MGLLAGCSKWNLEPKVLNTTPGNTNPLAIDVVLISGGIFNMGSVDGEADEKPVHSVTVKSYSIGKYEVTNRDFQYFCTQTSRPLPPAPGWGRPETYPVVNVNFTDATAYCQWLSTQTGKAYRLPTEAEWEYAARGGNKSKNNVYSGSNSANDVAWYTSTATNGTPYPVGLKQANELGIYDMSGNAWEWCSDWSSTYASTAVTNPIGPRTGTARVLRGGSYDGGVSDMRAANRGSGSPDASFQARSVGFRVARDE